MLWGMGVPGWVAALVTAGVFAAFLAAFGTASGDWNGVFWRAAGWTLPITGLLLSAGHAHRGYEHFGLSSGWAWAAVVAHLAVMLLVVLVASHDVHFRELHPPPPFLPEDDIAYLARYVRVRRFWRIALPGSVLAMVLVGMPAADRWSLLATMGWITLAAVATPFLFGLVAGLWVRWRNRRSRPLLSWIDPVGWGMAQLRVAERENWLFVVDDLIGDLGRRSRRPALRRRRRTKMIELIGSAMLLRHRMSGEREDLDRAIEVLRSLLELPAPRVDPHRSARRLQLSTALHAAYLATSDPRFLEESIQLQRRILEQTPQGTPLWTLTASNLAVSLSEQHFRDEDLPTLRESIGLQRQAIAATPTQPYREVLVSALPVIFSPRTGRAQRRAAREAVTHAVTNSHHLAARLTNLGTSLMFLHTADKDAETLAEGVAALRRALELMPADHALRPWALRQLADGLCVTHADDPRTVDLAEVTGLLQTALDILPADHPDQAAVLFLLGDVTARRHADSADAQDREAAVEFWRRAYAVPTAPPDLRVIAARRWGALCAEAGDWPAAADGLAAAVGLLPRLASRSLTRATRERQLSHPAGVIGDAAACALAAGQPQRALELLELGRGVLLSQTLDTRSDLGLLRAAHPGLAERFVRIRDQFDLPQSSAAADGIDTILQRHTLAREWETLLAEIRDHAGFAGFLQPSSATDLVEAAGDDTIVLVNLSEYRCDALVLTGGELRVVSLPQVGDAAVVEQTAAFYTALAAGIDPQRTLRDRLHAEASMREVLGWLWDAIAAPVLDSGPGGGRLWWVPTGLLAMLPLHAAQPVDGSTSVADRVISSYAPTIRALRSARAQAAASRPADPLIVAVASADGVAALPGALDEAAAVAGLFPRARVLTGHEATRDRITAELPGAPLVHFACHAFTDVTAVASGRLLLQDGPLGVVDIDQLRIPDGWLAYLSACATAQGSVELLDETIHLTSAFQLAGYAHVVGTLWPTSDRTAAALATAFYTGLRAGSPVHVALHEAVAAQRAAAPRSPSLWTSYIHVGP
ncbi:hypothetical protein CS0771_53110 [Catellatospora sp. IY07-71]|uniref:CHAT domain-containing protein n=1 Tax=Catellatospora sp. IY07-71 TaxID=2728827 RepID=UPI001BB38400|nr:CHAT domain-containing protein [Catellatospora sp. IY07-71]BCJ75767.1 hypothetical protein CS0771_53110 [Catellatospora sp. IY07-71]